MADEMNKTIKNRGIKAPRLPLKVYKASSRSVKGIISYSEMEDNMDAEEYLMRVERVQVYIETTLQEIETIRDKATSITSQPSSYIENGVRKYAPITSAKGGHGDKVGEAGAIIADIERERLIPLLREHGEHVETLQRMKSAKLYKLLCRRYIDGVSLAKIAEEEGLTRGAISTRHRQAVKELQAVLDCYIPLYA